MATGYEYWYRTEARDCTAHSSFIATMCSVAYDIIVTTVNKRVVTALRLYDYHQLAVLQNKTS